MLHDLHSFATHPHTLLHPKTNHVLLQTTNPFLPTLPRLPALLQKQDFVHIVRTLRSKLAPSSHSTLDLLQNHVFSFFILNHRIHSTDTLLAQAIDKSLDERWLKEMGRRLNSFCAFNFETNVHEDQVESTHLDFGVHILKRICNN